MGTWDKGVMVRGSPGSKPRPCKHEPKLRASLPWGGSEEKPPRAQFGDVSQAFSKHSQAQLGPGCS